MGNVTLVEIRKVLNELSKLLPSHLMEQLYVAGGCIRSLENGETPKDYDIFMKTDISDEIKSYLATHATYTSNNSVGLHIYICASTEVQIITSVFGTPEQVVGEFDFENNMNWFDPQSDILVTNKYCHSKQLKVNKNCRNVVGTLVRISKFVERGYKVPSVQDMTNLAIKLSKLPEITRVSQLVDYSRISTCCTPEIAQEMGLDEDIDYDTAFGISRGSGL